MARCWTVCATLAIILFGVLAVPAGAQPEPWAHLDGTIHYYHAVAAPSGIARSDAEVSAASRGGYLASVSSQSENNFIFGLIDSSRYWYQRPGTGVLAGPWLGGTRTPGSPNPDSGWRWPNSESFSYRNWTPGQPDNLSENAMDFGEAMTRVATWNSVSDTETAIRGYVAELSASQTTVGLTQIAQGAFEGYTLFSPLQSRMTYLIDNKGRLVHTWHSPYSPGHSVYLLENGELLRPANVGNSHFVAGGQGGRVERLDWDGNLLWSYNYSSSSHCQHHDIRSLPNGNVLMIAWELKTRAEAIAAGRNPSRISDGELWPDCLIEVNPVTDSIVWEWHVWEHLVQDYDAGKANYGVVAQHSELADLNYIPTGSTGVADWLHTNSVDYNAELDQVVISVHNFNEAWVIDHSTTTEQARGHTGGRQGQGGDILYRWGNPVTYGAGTSANRKFYGQHNAHWIKPGLTGAGHILVFNNGLQRPGSYSTVDELAPAVDSTGRYARPSPGTPFGPPALCWQYAATPPNAMYSPNISGAQRLPNGNTLICVGASGKFREVTRDSQVVWRYVNAVLDSVPLEQGAAPPAQNNVFRATRYAPDYPGLAGRDLTPGYPIERYGFVPTGIAEPRPPAVAESPAIRIQPGLFARATSIGYSLPISGNVTLRLYDAAGREVRTLVNGYHPAGSYSYSLLTTHYSLARGLYYCRLEVGGLCATQKLVRL